MDKTELKENRRKLELYTERLEFALLGSDAGLWDWNMLTGEVYFSERWCSMLGYKISEVEPHVSSWERLVHPDDISFVKEALERHIDGTTELYQTEHRVLTRSGEWKWILDTGRVTRRNTSGKALRAVGTHIDITERKEAEELSRIERELSNRLNGSESFDETLSICLEAAIENPGMDCGGIYIEDESDGSYKLIKSKGLSDDFTRIVSFYPSDSANAGIIRKGEPVYRVHRDLVKDSEALKIEEFKATAVLPIVYLDRAIGCINIASRKLDNISEFSRRKLEMISSHIGSFIIQAKHEDKIRQNQQDLNTLFNTIDDFLFILDMRGNMIHVNSTVTSRLGYEEGELLDRNVLMVHPKERQEEAFRIITSMLQGTETICRVPLVCKDGSCIPVETKVKQGKWEGRDVIIGITRDTSERQAYERKLIDNEERLEMALMASDAGLWDWNIKTGSLVLNDKWYSLRGYRAGEKEPTFNTWKALLHPDDLSYVLNSLNDHLEGKVPFYQVEYRSLTKAGHYIWILDTGKVMEYDGNGKPLRIIGTNIDVTSKKENDLILQQNFRQQELLSEIALEMNALENFCTRVNSILAKIGNHTGVSRVYIFEDTPDGKATNNTYEWCNRDISPQINELQEVPYEMIPSWKEMLDANGRVYSEDIAELPQDLRDILEPQGIKSIIVYPLYVRGNFFGFIGFDECTRNKSWSRTELEFLRTFSGIIANAYERKIMEQSIIDERDKANAANRAKSEFLANMSHEIRTPMNAVLGFSEALYHKLDSEKHRKMVKSILGSGNLLLSLLNDILDLSKIEAGKLDIVPQPVDLKNVLNEITFLFRDKAEKKGVNLNVFLPGNIPGMLMLDDIRINQVIFNLVGNAVKFTNQGNVNLRIGFNPGADQSGDLTIVVEDSGIGIPEEEQSSIFEAFRQQSGQSNRKYGGAGLGLAISKRLVEKMNGVISVSSRPGEGSAFTVCIPGVQVSSLDPRKHATTPESLDLRFSDARMMITDDVRSNIDFVEDLLADTGIEVSSAENGETALEILRSRPHDLILLDLRMPGMDGFEVARHIKSEPGLSEIRIIAYTASVMDMEKIKKSGLFDGILTKPLVRAELFSMLAKFLSHSVVTSPKHEEKETLIELGAIPQHVFDLFPFFMEAMESRIIPKWEVIKDQLVLYQIEEFAGEIRDLAQRYNFRSLQEYADKINSELESFELDKLKGTVNEFSHLINKLSLLNKN